MRGRCFRRRNGASSFDAISQRAPTLRLCKEFADQHGAPFAIGSAVAKVWENAAAELGDRDFTRIVELFESRLGVVVKGKEA